MSRIRPNADVTGLAGFPAEYRVLGTDDLGDVLAVDGKGRVWCFAHGNGDWTLKTSAFADEAQFRAFVEFQHELEPPRDEETIDELRDRLARIKAFLRGRRGVPYARSAASFAVEELKDEIEDRRFAGSERGQSLAQRQEIGLRCDQALREAGAGDGWMVRPLANREDALGVAGPFAEPWTQDAVVELLRPIAAGYELVCYKTS